MVYNIPNYALIQQYGYYYTVQNCVLSTDNEDIQIMHFNTYQQLIECTQANNIELPVQDNTEEWLHLQ